LCLLPPSLTSPYPLFFFNYAATTHISTLSLHDALPILQLAQRLAIRIGFRTLPGAGALGVAGREAVDPAEKPVLSFYAGVEGQRSEEHTSELQSLTNLVCRLLLEKKNKTPHSHSDGANT